MEPAPDPIEGSVLWEPGPGVFERSRMADYFGWLARERGIGAADYPAVWDWSTRDPGRFWQSIWDYFQVGECESGPGLSGEGMPRAHWFSGTRLNYAASALAGVRGREEALLAYSEVRPPLHVGGDQLRLQVGSVAAQLRSLGVGTGDRVAAYLPNIPEAVVACLATASLGAIWSSCSPDFGEQAVLDRFQQIEPKVLFAVDGYRYGGRDFDRSEVVKRLHQGLPSLVGVIAVPYLLPEPALLPNGSIPWSRAVAEPQEPVFEEVEFEHPLWILFSSGTTGLPKAIVHSHGGIVLEHLKVLGLHADMGLGDRSFWFTTTGWMMWNYLIGALLVGASPVLFDGSPSEPDLGRLWSLAAEAGVTHFGTSAAHLAACQKVGIQPARQVDLGAMRFLGSTGSPLSPGGFAWIYRAVKHDVWVASLSGGTDLCTAFVLGCPGMPVRAGVIQCRGLGALVEAFDPGGRPLIDQVGELVIRAPMPSMPVCFWGDPDGARYRASYFAQFPGVWRHGDWVRIRPDGGVVIYGRSDSTINRHGVRMGTSEIYRVVEELEWVRDSLVVEVARPDGESWLALFMVLVPGRNLSDSLVKDVKAAIRTAISPRHVPDRVEQVAAIPRTLSGKKLEVPIKRILEGAEPGEVLDLDAVQEPGALAPFLELARTSGGAAGTDQRG
ncbi:MAG TPA: acetoacetate--CoA ligase [Candidatus Dormibacteraeota bacterium]